ncbi:MAG: nitrous oxide reductase accessory protein NosL [Candidatus Marinimicrobia bacterium]|nr:nitrous oxide reductase accessory protein NosL [Candidatus Neomarinimicrobiota bacterium]
MKGLLRIIIIFVAGLLVFSCAGGNEVEIAFGIDNCQSCNMVIDQPKEAAGLITGGVFYPFCNPICMIHAVNQLKNAQLKPLLVYISDYEAGGLIRASGATFFVGQIRTVMDYGVVAFANRNSADALARSYSGELLSYNEFRSRYENPDKIFTLKITAVGISPAKILADKGDVIAFKFDYQLETIDELLIHGYDDIGPIKLKAGVDGVIVKFIADKPGAGFPMELRNQQGFSSRLVVQGVHTIEEAL